MAAPRGGWRALQPDRRASDRVLAVPQERAARDELHVQRRHDVPVRGDGAQGSLGSRSVQEQDQQAVLCV